MRFHRVLLVVNPVARTVSTPTLAVIEKALSADFALEVAETKDKGHANELAAQAVSDGIDLVVVFSGDGTINEVGQRARRHRRGARGPARAAPRTSWSARWGCRPTPSSAPGC